MTPEKGVSEGNDPAFDKKSILRRRAKALAQEVQAAEDDGTYIDVVQFLIGGGAYGAETGYVREVYLLREWTPLVCAPRHVPGLLNLRGQVLPMLDLRVLLGLEVDEKAMPNKVIIVKAGEFEAGLLADEVHGVRLLPPRDLNPPPPTISASEAEYLKGVTPEPLIVLDVAALLRKTSASDGQEAR